MLFSIDDLWQGHFHIETVTYLQNFMLYNFRMKVLLFKLIEL